MSLHETNRKIFKGRISLIYIFYWVMLAYIVAALIFWYISLTNQSIEITNLKAALLSPDDAVYKKKMADITAERRAKIFQYIGEGSTFLILIIAGAIFVFRMLREQLRLSKQQKDFMMAITHELKTPIAVTKLNLETLLIRHLEPVQQKKIINSALAETERLNALCSNMLLLNEMGSAYSVSSENIQLEDLLLECTNEYKNRLDKRRFSISTQPDLQIKGDRMLLKLAINNLLDNAIKYSPKESVVTIRSYTTDQHTFIEVKDTGKGIAKEEVSKIFLKYFRGSTQQAKGTGLGLYVTRQIIRQNNGQLTYRPNQPNGSIFIISFVN